MLSIVCRDVFSDVCRVSVQWDSRRSTFGVLLFRRVSDRGPHQPTAIAAPGAARAQRHRAPRLGEDWQRAILPTCAIRQLTVTRLATGRQAWYDELAPARDTPLTTESGVRRPGWRPDLAPLCVKTWSASRF